MEYQGKQDIQVQGTQSQATSTDWNNLNLSEYERTLGNQLFIKLRDMYIKMKRPIHYTLKQAQADMSITRDQYIKLMDMLQSSGRLQYVSTNSYGVREYVLPEFQDVYIQRITPIFRTDEDANNPEWMKCRTYFDAQELYVNSTMTYEEFKVRNETVIENCPANADTTDQYVEWWWNYIFKSAPTPSKKLLSPIRVWGNTYAASAFINWCKANGNGTTTWYEYFNVDEYVERRRLCLPINEIDTPYANRLMCCFDIIAGQNNFHVDRGWDYNTFYENNKATINILINQATKELAEFYVKWWWDEIYQKETAERTYSQSPEIPW